MKKYIKIDDPLTELSEKIRKGYFETGKPVHVLLNLTCSKAVSQIRINLKQLSLIVLFLLSGLQAGADDYIPKDIFATEHLINTLTELGILE